MNEDCKGANDMARKIVEGWLACTLEPRLWTAKGSRQVASSALVQVV